MVVVVVDVSEALVCDCRGKLLVERSVEFEVDVAFLRRFLRYYFPISKDLLFVDVADLSLVI